MKKSIQISAQSQTLARSAIKKSSGGGIANFFGSIADGVSNIFSSNSDKKMSMPQSSIQPQMYSPPPPASMSIKNTKINLHSANMKNMKMKCA